MASKIFVRMVRSISTLSHELLKVDFSKKYEEAVKTLNTLQSNAQTLERIRREKSMGIEVDKIAEMTKFIERAGMTMEDVDKLPFIHVSGTKGKGSTCAFAECILRHHGYKTGFFSSPHLIEVRERFRINGCSIAKESFSSYFWEVYSRLETSREQHNGTMPGYFAFLTVMAFHVFIKEKVDVVVLEVGIGGQKDSTNVIRNPVVCGVTSLGLDHTSILGASIDKIAWSKAGIFKPNSVAVTVDQPAEAMKVLQERAQEKQVPLYIAPPLCDYKLCGSALQLGIRGTKQALNASLALQLCKIFINKKTQGNTLVDSGTMEKSNALSFGLSSSIQSSEVPEIPAFSLTSKMETGLKLCHWAGRSQCVKRPEITYYLDGAHTTESIEQCVEWFKEAALEEERAILGKIIRILVFNSTGDRDPATLLSPLAECGFSAAVFCPNIIYDTCNTADNTNYTVSRESQNNRCTENKNTWKQISKRKVENEDSYSNTEPCQKKRKYNIDESRENLLENNNENCADQTKLAVELGLKEVPSSAVEDIKKDIVKNDTVIWTESFPSICKALIWATQGRDPLIVDNLKTPCVPNSLKEADHIQILITGSLHLVGGVLTAINEEVL